MDGANVIQFEDYKEAKVILKEVIKRQTDYFEKLHSKKESMKEDTGDIILEEA